MGVEMLRGALDKSLINSSVTQYWRVSVVDVTASTQNDLAALARSGKAKPGDVMAEEDYQEHSKHLKTLHFYFLSIFNQREIKKIGDGLH
jgi:hypothetical protein